MWLWGILFCLLFTANSAKLHHRRWSSQFPDDDNSAASRCGYESCPTTPNDMLNIHIVPHTHDDVGWLKTVDQYYYGSKTLTQMAGVQYILDSVVHELIRDPKKKFIWVESAFFFKWWDEQTDDLQAEVKKLVSEGRLEFIGGAWSMNDEATPHYQSLIDQFALGLRLLNETFGECGRPKVGWQIDPFGHSREMASIFAEMGYDGLFFARLDYEDKRERMRTKTPEMVWQASKSLGESSDLFSGVLYNHYSAPPGFCFDFLCSDEPIIDDKFSPDYNVDSRVFRFFEYVRNVSAFYRTNNIMIPMGDDFNFQDAQMYYKNIDKLIKYGNAQQANNSNINLFYSTPSCYLKSLHEANITWPVKKEDFFPYSTDPHAFWTGYFTSRPTQKRFERTGNHFLQVCKQLSNFAERKGAQFDRNLNYLREVMGIMQHHDAITGTEKANVADDYARQLDAAISACNENTAQVLNEVTNQGAENPVQFEFQNCLNLNISVCEISETRARFMVTLYNPLSHNSTQFVRFPVQGDAYEVRDHNGNVLDSQVVPIPDPIRNLKFRYSAATNELVFEAKYIPVKGYQSFFVSRRITDAPEKPTHANEDLNSDTKKENTVTFDDNSHLISVTVQGKTVETKVEYFYYEGAFGNNEVFENRSSGAYIFRPNNTIRSVQPGRIIRSVFGPLVDEHHIQFNDWISHVVRFYRGQRYAEIEWLIGSIPIEDKIGKEIIVRLSTNLSTQGIFYTDSNGREMLKRELNKRETFVPNLEEFISGNYYPITTKISIEDSLCRLSVLTDRAQGGSSIKNGSIDLMLHRRLLHDDAFGVGEALDEHAFGAGIVARGKFYIIAGEVNDTIVKEEERILQLEKHLPHWAFFSDVGDLSFDDWKNFKHQNSFWPSELESKVNFLTLEPWGPNRTLLRFENILSKDDGGKSVVVNLAGILPNEFKKQNTQYEIRETTLDGSLWLDQAKRFNFRIDGEKRESDSAAFTAMNSENLKTQWNQNSKDFDIVLKHMQIRTFILSRK